MIKTCIICGTEYVARRSDAKYCSERCRVAAKRGTVYAEKPAPPVFSVGMTEDEVLDVVSRAHGVAADMSRASMLTPAPLCRSLKTISGKISDALEEEGL